MMKCSLAATVAEIEQTSQDVVSCRVFVASRRINITTPVRRARDTCSAPAQTLVNKRCRRLCPTRHFRSVSGGGSVSQSLDRYWQKYSKYSDWFGLAVTAFLSRQRSYATSSPVSTGIGDDLERVCHSVQTTQAHSAWPSLRA